MFLASFTSDSRGARPVGYNNALRASRCLIKLLDLSTAGMEVGLECVDWLYDIVVSCCYKCLMKNHIHRSTDSQQNVFFHLDVGCAYSKRFM